jgi:hypothetical protein
MLWRKKSLTLLGIESKLPRCPTLATTLTGLPKLPVEQEQRRKKLDKR